MPEKSRLKNIAVYSFFALPPALFLLVLWILSVNTSLFHSLGQIILMIIIATGILFLSGWLIYNYVFRKYEAPAELIYKVISDIKSGDFKPLPKDANLEEFSLLYQELTGLENAILSNNKTVASLNQKNKAMDELFQISLDPTTDPIIVLDTKSQLKYLNPAAEAISGIRKSNANGRRIDQFVRFYNKNNVEIPPSLYLTPSKDNASNKIFFSSEVRIISAINIQSFADVSVFKVAEGADIDVLAVILFHDKTKEKQLEAMKLDFVSMAAHELRTPLTSIKGYISVFLNENEKILTPDQLMFVRRINTSTQQLAGLVENLLSVARVERGALSLHTQVIDWVANVNSQVDTFLHRADEKRITLSFIKPEKPIPKVDVDLVRINEVLNNLISNALSYTEPLGKIDISINTKDDMVITCVKDSGKGIPPEALTKLFTKFFRVSGGAAEQASKGNGLGLYLSKAIVELHHGKIWAESEGAGKGSIFCFSLPAVKETIDLNILTKSL